MRVGLISACSLEDPPHVERFHKAYLFSAKKAGFDPIVLRTSWDAYKYPRNLCEKVSTYSRFIEAHCNEYDVLICSDAYDVVFQLPKDELVSRFLKLNSPIVSSCEAGCFPMSYEKTYPKSPTKYAYLNSGFFVGFPCNLLDLFRGFTAEEIATAQTDQELFQIHFTEGRTPHITLDYYAQLCFSMCTTRDIVFEGGVYRNRVVDVVPCALHGNGNGYLHSGIFPPIIKNLFPEL